VVISEFMAVNSRTLADEDGAYPDWLELYNAGANTVNLDQWCLTDSASTPAKWRFPATNLPPYSYLLVFASGKDRAVPGAPLHTSFKLAGSGQYLALLEPDGQTVAFEYSPRYPAQQSDVSYGLGMVPGLTAYLAPTGATARILVPTNDLGSAWTAVAFNDSSWLSGRTGLGFDASTNYQKVIATDVRTRMRNVNASAYVRVPFQVTDPARFQEMKLRMRYDDGFIAYLNGAEILRTNAPLAASWNSAATATHGNEPGVAGGLMPAEEFNLSRFIPVLRPGSNVLAIQGLNIVASDGDFLLQPELSARGITLQATSQLYFALPTPGALNPGGVADIIPPPRFSPPGGVFATNRTVVISSTVSNAVIHFTRDGSAPSEASPVYSAPVAVTNSVMLRARAYAAGHFPSLPVTEGYTLLETNLLGFSSELPLVIIDTYNQGIGPDMNPRAPAMMTIIDAAQPSQRARCLDRSDFHGRIGLEGRGQSSWGGYDPLGYQKQPYNFAPWDENDQDLKAAFLDYPAGSDFSLLNVYNDKSFLNDFLAHELFEKMGHYQVRRRYVEVFWNGTPPEGTADPSGKVGTNDYVGIYLLLEKIRIDPNRVDIQTPQSGAPDDPITGGYIWKKDKDSPGDVNFSTPSGQVLKYHDPRGENLSAVQRQWLADYLAGFEGVLYGPNWLDPVNGYASYLDASSFVDLHWIVEYSKQIDGYRLSSYFQKDRGGKIKWEPIWDWNLSFGNANYAQCGLTNGWYWSILGPADHIWEHRLMVNPGDPDYNQRIADRWAELRQDVLHPSNVLARVDQITNLLYEATTRDFRRWPRLGRALWPNPDGTGDGRDVNYVSPTNYSGIIQQWKNYVVMRTAWIDSQFLAAPCFSRSSGFPAAPLAMSAPAGTIYYTVDGSDSRSAGGGISPRARVCTGFVTLPPDARVVARAFLNNAWSAPTRGLFGSPTPLLAVTELMYHPAAPPPGDPLAADEDFEFIEIKNQGPTNLDLTGFRLTGGVDYTFPPGPLVPAGAATTNDFDAAGTAYAARTLGAGPGVALTTGGPAGRFLRLTSLDTGTNRNRIAFAQTAADAYARITAEFDFRATNTSAPPATGAPTLQDFDADPTNYVLTGTGPLPAVQPADAGSQGMFMRLTPAVGGLLNTIYFKQTAVGIYNTVVATFDFRFTSGSPADGMAFALLDTATHGTNGVSPVVGGGISEEPGIANALGVGFDIYDNANPPIDNNANHVSLHWNGAQVTLPPVTPNFNMVAGVFHRARITIRFDSGSAYVSVMLTPNVYAGGTSQTLYDNYAIPGVAPFNGRVAFGARTGGANAAQDLDNVNVQYLNLSAPGGLSLLLLPAAAFGTNGPGSTLTNYLDAPTLTNAFALDFALHNHALVNHVGLYWNGALCGSAYLPSAGLDLDGGAFHHVRLELKRTPRGAASPGAWATVILTPDVYGAGGAPILVFSNLLLSSFPSGDTRLEFAGRSGSQNLQLDLDNVSVSYGRTMPNQLAAGATLLLVRNRLAFESRYGTGLPVAGEYTGHLKNSGDHLFLSDTTGLPIFDFTYSSAWSPLTDGLGFSLVSANPGAPLKLWSDASNWRASSQVGGSPRLDDPAPTTFLPVLVNEVLSHPDTNLTPGLMDAIELFNPSTNQSVDVGHWYLTDDFAAPAKYRLPSPTLIGPGGSVVFRESDFGAGPNGFGLRAEGEEVYLFSADAGGELTGYFHGSSFGASEANVSLGRYVDSLGREHFVAQQAMTLGTNNAGPQVGPVVISEVMYHPPDWPGGVDNLVHEYVELHNLTGQPVPLFEPAYPLNGWHLRGGVDFSFPPGAQIPAQGYALIVNFDPRLDSAALASFLAQYGLGTNVPLYGPYGGKLNNGGGNLELAKPVVFGTNAAAAAYVLVDKVEYSDNSPWPLAADGIGFSLQRVADDQYGNDPINWVAGPPTPGGASAPATPPVILAQPTNQTVLARMTVTSSVTAGGLGPFRYQWRCNAANLAGATNPVLVLPNVQVTQAGTYQVVVMNLSGATDSAVATLVVNQGPILLTSPTDRTVYQGNNTTFSVSATGNGPVSYQWRLDGVNLAGATNAALTLTGVSLAQAGSYSVGVSDAVGTIEPAPAWLAVLPRPAIVTQPVSRTVVVGEPITLRVGLSGTPPFYYRWRKNTVGTNVFVEPSTNISLVFSNAVLTNAGIYDAIITNLAGGTLLVRTTNAYVHVVVPPTNQAAPPHGTVLLRAIVATPNTFERLHQQLLVAL
jgi:hypothetical protein